MKKIIALVVCCLFVFQSQILGYSFKEKDIKIRGYITKILSDNDFEIEDYRIHKDEGFELEFENEDKDLKFSPEQIRVGTEVEIRGKYNEETGVLKAKKIKFDLSQFKEVNHTVVLSRAPQGLEKSEQGWYGILLADGRRIKITPTTKLFFKLNKTEKKVAEKTAKEEKKSKEKKEDKEDNDEEDDDANYEIKPLTSLSEITPGIIMSYWGKVETDGTVAADKVEFIRNELEKGEASLWKSLGIKIKEPQYSNFKQGELKIDRIGKFKLLPNKEVQDYVSRLGQSLIPEYMRNLPDSDPMKINFRFFVVEEKNPNAFALANGVIVFYTSMFQVVENEAQLASILGHEISHSIQEHTWRQQQYHRKKLMALKIGGFAAAAFGMGGIGNIATLIEAAVRSGYSRSLENQADRVGLQYIVDAGYDPREAPRVWKLMAQKYGDSPTNLFWSGHDNHTTRRSYLMLEMRNNYAELNYADTKKGEEEYKKIADLVAGSTKKKEKIKVKN